MRKEVEKIFQEQLIQEKLRQGNRKIIHWINL